MHTPVISALFGALFATGVIIDEKLLLPVGTIGAGFTVVWWLASKLQRIVDRLDQISEQAKKMEETVKVVASLPCVALGRVCDDAPSQKKPLKML